MVVVDVFTDELDCIISNFTIFAISSGTGFLAERKPDNKVTGERELDNNI